MLENMHGKNTQERKRATRNFSILRDMAKSDDEKHEAVKSKLLSEPELKFYGHNVIRKSGEEVVLGVIRSFKRLNDNGNLKTEWNIFYPFYNREIDGDSEFLDADEVAWGLIDAHKAGKFGLHHFHDSNSATSEATQDHSIQPDFPEANSRWTKEVVKRVTCNCGLPPKLRTSKRPQSFGKEFYRCGRNFGFCNYYREKAVMDNFIKSHLGN